MYTTASHRVLRGSKMSVFALAVALFPACRAKISANERNAAAPVSPAVAPAGASHDGSSSGSGTDAAPHAEATPIPATSLATRRYFQSRSQLSLGVRAATFSDNDSVTVINDSAGAAIFEDWSLAAPVAADLGIVVSFARETDGGPRDLNIAMAPGSTLVRHRLVYGENKFRLLLSDGGDAERIASVSLFRRDCVHFGLALSTAVSGDELNGGFEGDVPLVDGGTWSNGVSVLESGSLTILNR